MTVATTSPASPDEESEDTYVSPTTYYHYTGQHGKPKTIAIYSIRKKKIDVELLAQAVIALGEQLAEEEKEKKPVNNSISDV
jgi:TfoX/Sxy family transcriptional regulator of competence genes